MLSSLEKCTAQTARRKYGSCQETFRVKLLNSTLDTYYSHVRRGQKRGVYASIMAIIKLCEARKMGSQILIKDTRQ